jgi:hypothetical protein
MNETTNGPKPSLPCTQFKKAPFSSFICNFVSEFEGSKTNLEDHRIEKEFERLRNYIPRSTRIDISSLVK